MNVGLFNSDNRLNLFPYSLSDIFVVVFVVMVINTVSTFGAGANGCLAGQMAMCPETPAVTAIRRMDSSLYAHSRLLDDSPRTGVWPDSV